MAYFQSFPLVTINKPYIRFFSIETIIKWGQHLVQNACADLMAFSGYSGFYYVRVYRNSNRFNNVYTCMYMQIESMVRFQ